MSLVRTRVSFLKLLNKLRWNVLQETSCYSAILLNDQTVSIRSFMLHKKPTNQFPPPPHTHTHNIPEVFVVSVTYLKSLLVLALNTVVTISVGVHSVQHFRIPIYTQGNSYQEGERFKVVGSNRTCRWHSNWQNWTKLVQDWRHRQENVWRNLYNKPMCLIHRHGMRWNCCICV